MMLLRRKVKMKIESIKIKNYKVFKDAYIDNLSHLAVFLGPNSSGKSTLFDIFAFLGDALQHNVTIALNKRGGFPEVLSRGCDIEKDAIDIEIKSRNEETGTGDQSAPLITYSLQIKSRRGKAIIEREILKYQRGGQGSPWHFLDFSGGEGKVIVNEEDFGKKGVKEQWDEQKLTNPDILALKGLGQFDKFKVASTFRSFLEKWYISHFRIETGRNGTDTGISHHLSVTGDNLARVSKYIYDNHRNIFDDILRKLPGRIPGINKVEAKITEDGRIVLRFQDENFKAPFAAPYVSDGTIKIFAYMILLYDPEPHPLLCIEEPENFLYPDLLSGLCEEIRGYAERGGQVFVSTHSPDFVNGLDIRELFFLQKEKGFSTIKAASEDKYVCELAKENKLGWLWRNHYIKGANLE
jgi:predicted ATPase